MAKWSSKSQAKLDTCHIDIQRIANEVLKIHDCSVFEGFRDEETQNKYYRNKTSKVMFPNGKHNVLPSMAIDLAPYKRGDDPYDMENVLFFAGIVNTVAYRLYVDGKISHQLKWGGNWSTEADTPFAFDVTKPNGKKGFFDGIHFELVD